MADPEITRLDHVNLRTAQLDTLVAWYRDMLGLVPGARPDFDFPGTWLYAGDRALVHLIGVQSPPADDHTDLRLEHFAFSATGLKPLLARLKAAGARTRLRRVTGFPVVQLNVWDPDDNHLHIDFDLAEAEGLEI